MPLRAEYQRLGREHCRATHLRVARATLGSSVMRVFAQGTRPDLIDALAGVPIAELPYIHSEDTFRPWFERQLDATATAIARRNANNARIHPGARWGHGTKVLTIFLREIVSQSRLFRDEEVARIEPLLFVPLDSVFDAFTIEPNERPLHEVMFLREGKFSVGATTPEHDRTYPPSSYATVIELNDYYANNLFPFFVREMGRPDDESWMTALRHFHRARLNTPYFTSVGEDASALWAGFEAMFHISPDEIKRDKRVLGELELLLPKIHLELRPETWTGLRKWVEQIYQVRCAHVHGGVTLPSALMPDYQRHVFTVGVILAESILKVRAFDDNSLIARESARKLDHLFIEKPFTDRLIRRLKSGSGADWPLGDANAKQATKIRELDELLLEVISIPRLLPGYKGDPALAKARQRMGRVLARWFERLAHATSDDELRTIATEIDGWVKDAASTHRADDEIDSGIVRLVVKHRAHDEESYRMCDDPLLRMSGILPIWRWVGGFIRLHELYSGHRRI